MSSNSSTDASGTGASTLLKFGMVVTLLGSMAYKFISEMNKPKTTIVTCPFTGQSIEVIDTSSAKKCPFAAFSKSSSTSTSAPPAPANSTPPTTPFTPASTTSLSKAHSTTNLPKPKRGQAPVHYHSYLALDDVLNAQHLKSAVDGSPGAHDEMLFIITHQTHELWFKQIIHDIKSVLNCMQQSFVDEREMGKMIERLGRVCKIQKLLIGSLGVLETMTPLDFLEFRDYLFPASGFQSMQFRKLEVLLGLRRKTRLVYGGQPYDCALNEDQVAEIQEMEKDPSLFDVLEKWLCRTPVLKVDNFDFSKNYRDNVLQMLHNDKLDLQSQLEKGVINEVNYLGLVKDNESQRESFIKFFDEKAHDLRVAAGDARLSFKACQAVLMINFYQEEPLFQVPYQLLSLLIEIDENLSQWRAKHASMVHRMLGLKMGTGGSSGYAYLSSTIRQHRIFHELPNLASLLVPRSCLPPLPPHVLAMTGFHNVPLPLNSSFNSDCINDCGDVNCVDGIACSPVDQNNLEYKENLFD